MATENKRYLDLEGLSHLIEKLKDEKRIVAHPDDAAVSAAAVKVGHDADGHVVLGDPLKYSDLQDRPTIGNGTLTIQANGTSKGTFTANQTDNKTINITAADLGLTNAMHFKGVLSSLPTPTTADAYVDGDVILVGNKEYVRSGKTATAAGSWVELGDESSHALKTISISAGEGLTGGGTLESNRTISHAADHTAATAAAVKVGQDKFGHVILGGALTTANNGKHTHSVNATIGKDTFLKGASANTTKISLNKGSDTFIKSYPGVTSKLVTTTITGTDGTVTASKATAGTAINVATTGTPVVYGTADVGATTTVATKATSATVVGNANMGAAITITGVSGSTTASKATAGTKLDIAKVGTAVTYGTADCGTAVTGVAKVKAEAITYGGANVGTPESVAYGVKSATAAVTQDAYTAAYNATDECLTLTPATISVTPTVTLNTKSINPAVQSSTTAYVCADGTGVSITPATASTKQLTPATSNGQITPYSFTDVTVPKAATTATTFNPAVESSVEIFGVAGTVDVTSATAADTTRKVTPAVANGTITPYTFADVVAAKKADSATTIATGALATNGGGDSLLVGLGNATTASALTSATIQSNATTGDVTVATGVATEKYTSDVTISGTAVEAGEHNHAVQ
jgi:hypothetical protein